MPKAGRYLREAGQQIGEVLVWGNPAHVPSRLCNLSSLPVARFARHRRRKRPCQIAIVLPARLHRHLTGQHPRRTGIVFPGLPVIGAGRRNIQCCDPISSQGRSQITRPKQVVVLGAGPAGLAAAHELSANGVRVTLLERNNYVGGLAATFKYKGYKFDLGGHRWFTKNESLNDWFRHLMEGELVLVNRISRIYHNGQYFNYPIRLKEILTQSHPLTIIGIATSFLWSSLKQAVIDLPIDNMERAYIAQFGVTLYRMFFQRYSEKVWGRPCTELSADWVAKRSRGLSVWALVASCRSARAKTS